MAPGLNTQTPKANKAKSSAAKRRENIIANNAANASSETAVDEKKETFPDAYAGSRWVPRWISVPIQLITLGIIFYNRKTALDERVAEMNEDDTATGATDRFDYPEDIGATGIADDVAKAVLGMTPPTDSKRRTANTRANNGEFEKKWRHVADGERWVEDAYEPWLYSSRCNIPKIAAADLSREEFSARFLEKLPVIITGATDTTKFAAAVQKAALLNKYGNHSVTLSSANKNSYDKQESQLLYYVDEMMAKPQTLLAKGNETWYHFGDNKHGEWSEVFDLYEKPNKYIYGPYASLSFGLGASGSGVPFHTHGHVFAEVFTGHKRWWLSPPAHEPLFGPDATSMSWLNEVYPFMMAQEDSDASEEERAAYGKLVATHRADAAAGNGKTYRNDRGDVFELAKDAQRFPPNPPYFYECTVSKGELLYIPGLWWHSTLNIGETVFMSVFV